MQFNCILYIVQILLFVPPLLPKQLVYCFGLINSHIKNSIHSFDSGVPAGCLARCSMQYAVWYYPRPRLFPPITNIINTAIVPNQGIIFRNRSSRKLTDHLLAIQCFS